MDISIVIPVYNEEESVGKLHAELKAALVRTNKKYEIIFVDDGSRDETFNVLKNLNPVKIIRFRRNFGQTAALDAGFKAAQGDVIVSMDGDGQDDPAEMDKLIAGLGKADVVIGSRVPRRDSLMKRFVSWGAYLLRQWLLKDNIKDSGTTFRAYKREALDGLDLYGEEHRVLPALIQLRGYSIKEIPVKHRARVHGQTKYNWKRTAKGFLDIINVWFWQKYSARPLHFFGGLGLLFFSLGSLLLAFLGVGRMLQWFALGNRIWPLVGIFLVLAGLQLFVSGLLADMVMKNSSKDGKKKAYEIKEIKER